MRTSRPLPAPDRAIDARAVPRRALLTAGVVLAVVLSTVLAVSSTAASAAPATPPPPAAAPKPGPPKPGPAKPPPPPPPAPVMGEYQTGGFAADSGVNIRIVAQKVNNAVVAPGATFSLNGFTGPRTARQGYVDAGIIDNGAPARGIGGGISQFATTLYNATYFAGLAEVEHKPHSYWISRYPAGRDATVFDGLIDLKFRNDGPTPVTIRTFWTPKTIKVQILGPKRFDVTSSTGARVAPKPHTTRTVPGGPTCKPSNGVDGFTIGDTRTLFAPGTKRVIRTDPLLVVHYDPEPTIKCGPPPPKPKAAR